VGDDGGEKGVAESGVADARPEHPSQVGVARGEEGGGQDAPKIFVLRRIEKVEHRLPGRSADLAQGGGQVGGAPRPRLQRRDERSHGGGAGQSQHPGRAGGELRVLGTQEPGQRLHGRFSKTRQEASRFLPVFTGDEGVHQHGDRFVPQGQQVPLGPAGDVGVVGEVVGQKLLRRGGATGQEDGG
jgi:hypothetical protein